MISRRSFAKLAVRAGIAAATAPLWQDALCARAFATMRSGYRAVVLVTLTGGNDGNNVLIPMDNASYAQYASLRTALALPQSACHVLSSPTGSPVFGLHPSLSNLAQLYNSGVAALVTNVGPLVKPVTKAALVADPGLTPEALLSHPAGVNQWESASAEALPLTGWGGRIADLITSQSGSLPPILDASGESIFTVGRSIQAVSVSSSGGAPSVFPAGIQDAILAIAQNDTQSSNQIVSQAAELKVQALNLQTLIAQAQTSGPPLKTVFPGSGFASSLQAIASIINGRGAIGASRQIFYVRQGEYDTHANQLGTHAANLSELDGGLGAFMAALQEMGLSDQVLVCTHSDFNRTMLSNTAGGSDHAWGNQQLILGGGIRGGQIIGTYPDLDLGGSMDLNGYGTWIPSLSVSQMVASIAAWMGLSSTQIAEVFPDLANFPTGYISLV